MVSFLPTLLRIFDVCWSKESARGPEREKEKEKEGFCCVSKLKLTFCAWLGGRQGREARARKTTGCPLVSVPLPAPHPMARATNLVPYGVDNGNLLARPVLFEGYRKRLPSQYMLLKGNANAATASEPYQVLLVLRPRSRSLMSMCDSLEAGSPGGCQTAVVQETSNRRDSTKLVLKQDS